MEVQKLVLMSEWQRDLIEAIKAGDMDEMRKLLPRAKFNYSDEYGMSPLQHASYKGNKEAVQIMLDLGADVEFNQHGSKYTALHFAALSGNIEVCRLLLDAGIDPHAVNGISRTAAHLAAFVGNHACVEAINHYVKQADLKCYTVAHGKQTEPLIPPLLLPTFHKFVISIDLHPVRIALNMQESGIAKHLKGLQRALELLCEGEMKKSQYINEVLALKYHYLRWITKELLRVQENRKVAAKDESKENEKNHDFIELFIKRVLKENKQGDLDYLEYVVREAVREFPYWESTIFRQVAQQLASKDSLPAVKVLRNAINGHRLFAYENPYCSTCGNEKPDKKCSKCKIVQYCDRECQRLHWFMHKKSCARPTASQATPVTAVPARSHKPSIDTSELRTELSKFSIK